MKKPAWMKNKTILIITIALSVCLLALAITGITYAVWTRVSEDNQSFTAPIQQYNPSEKYIVFRGLDEDGNLLESDENAVSYAVVGYGSGKGLVGELVIPDTHNDKPVVKILTSNISNDYEYRLNGNPIITSIQIPASVTHISVSACAEMSLLEKVVILGDGDLTIGDYAFADCPRLKTFDCSRNIIGSPEKYLLGSN